MTWVFEKKYRMGRLLGKGGMGEVWAATHVVSKRRVAIKLIKREQAARLGISRRFEIEAEAMGALQHPNIVQLLDCGETAEYFYLVMELVPGSTLRQLIAKARRADTTLDVPFVIHVMVHVANAMSTAHKVGIVHRDLKPANIMVSEEGRVWVIDFGLAKQTNPEGTEPADRPTAPGAIPGTPLYMAPEQVRSQPVDARTWRAPQAHQTPCGTRAPVFSWAQAPLPVVRWSTTSGRHPPRARCARKACVSCRRCRPPAAA